MEASASGTSVTCGDRVGSGESRGLLRRREDKNDEGQNTARKAREFKLRASTAKTQAGKAFASLCYFSWSCVLLAEGRLFFSPLIKRSTSRVRLLSLGCAGWGTVAIFLASSTFFWQFALLKVLNGVAMASIGPVAQSLIADLFPPTMRGEHFGWLQLFLCAGCILGAMLGGSLASITVIEGVKGWRVAFFTAGVLSLFAAALVQVVAKEPRRHPVAKIDERNEALALNRGICGYIPLHAFQFYTLYFQYVGMPDWQASLLTACPLVGGLLGSLFGGWLGDQAERFNAFHGRPLVGQLGTLLALPLIYIGLLGIPRRPEFFGLYAIDMLFLGFAISWCPSGVNRPILSEIVEPDSRATVFATQIAIEGSVSALLGSPVIALLAESIFGYKTGVPSHAAADTQRNTDALANALLVATAFPWTVCFFLYGLMHFTYPKDSIAYEQFRSAHPGAKDDKQKNSPLHAAGSASTHAAN
ncbi:transmembrane domain-containing protein, putative [Eimeria praecox]|uniref:Transmembrane domain-containing protein, putative n=1 Tax=Eimeria praecox TaxID=51316 RepID=U6G9I4_9EIME|nr:transmembrane domain-containing protein, putative [Eimeria praecox]